KGARGFPSALARRSSDLPCTRQSATGAKAGSRAAAFAIVMWTACSAATVLAQAPAPADGWVVLPVDEYRALRERAIPPPPATFPGMDCGLRERSVSIAGGALRRIELLKDGWTRVQIPAGLKARDARLDGQPVSLVEGPPASVLLARAGRFVLTLDIAMPLGVSAGTESIALPASPSPISRAPLLPPQNGVGLSAARRFRCAHARARR